jgi:hypothetical protein
VDQFRWIRLFKQVSLCTSFYGRKYFSSPVESNLRVSSRRLLRLPTEVQTGFKLQQIVSIDQQNEIMNAAGTIKLAWQDPKLAFRPDECDCYMKEYRVLSCNKRHYLSHS